MATTGDDRRLGGEPSAPNPFQRFYRSLAFDIVCGVIPGVLVGIYSLTVIGVAVYSVFKGEGSPAALIVLLLFLGGSGVAACTALLVSTLAPARLNPARRRVCSVLLKMGLSVALISLAVLAVIIIPQGSDLLWLFIPFALFSSLSLAAFKQIRLLSSGGVRAVFQ